ncbi:MAG: ATP-binding protein [Myxococcota bacterium]
MSSNSTSEQRIGRPLFRAPETPQAADGPGGVRDALTLIGMTALSMFLMFLLWEGIEQGFGRSDEVVELLHYSRGITTSLVTAFVVGWMAYRLHERHRSVLDAEIERRARDSLEARAAFEAVAEHSPAGLWILDEDYLVLFANSEARRIHGHDALVGERYPCEVARRDGGIVCSTCPAKHTLVTCEPAIKKGYRTEPQTGEVIAVETYPIDLSDGRNYVLVVEKVVTEQQRLQASLLLQEKMAAFGLLAAGVAHDMGNPLSGIDMHLQLLQDESLPDDANESVATVRREVARLRRTLRDLVDFARRRGSEATLVSVNSVIHDALRLLRYDRRMRGIETTVHADPETPPVHMVEDHLMQTTLNLILNSLDAMENGGKLEIEVSPTADGVALRIHDTGTGMTRDVLARCCDPLYSTKAPGRGTGLGLSMCKDILRAAGGELELHSAPMQGTTAVVTLPAAPDDLAGAAEIAHSDPSSSSLSQS